MSRKTEYCFCTDWDGTFVFGPPSIKARQARYKNIEPSSFVNLPSIENVQNQRRSLGIMGLLLAQLSPVINSPSLRSIKPDSLCALGLIDALQNELNLNIKKLVVSGRSPSGHSQLRQQLTDPSITGKFTEVLLNPGIRSHLWKVVVVSQLLGQGEKIVFFDDDLLALWRMSELNSENFLGYLIKNFSNKGLPPDKIKTLAENNVHLVSSMSAGVIGFGKKVKDGKF